MKLDQINEQQALALVEAMLGDEAVGVDRDGDAVRRPLAPAVQLTLAAYLGESSVPTVQEVRTLVYNFQRPTELAIRRTLELAALLENVARRLDAAADRAKERREQAGKL